MLYLFMIALRLYLSTAIISKVDLMETSFNSSTLISLSSADNYFLVGKFDSYTVLDHRSPLMIDCDLCDISSWRTSELLIPSSTQGRKVFISAIAEVSIFAQSLPLSYNILQTCLRNCSGNGNCLKDLTCECREGFGGNDCSTQVHKISEGGRHEQSESTWKFFYSTSSEFNEFKLKSKDSTLIFSALFANSTQKLSFGMYSDWSAQLNSPHNELDFYKFDKDSKYSVISIYCGQPICKYEFVNSATSSSFTDIMLKITLSLVFTVLCFVSVCIIMRKIHQNLISASTKPHQITVEEISSLIPQMKFLGQNSENDICSICLCWFNDEENVRVLNCSHTFHKDCIDKWISIKNLCPNCQDYILKANRTSA